MTQIDEPNLDKIDQEITDILLEHLVLANDNGQPYIQYTDVAVDKIINLISDQVAKARIEAFDVAFDCHDYDKLRAYRAKLLKEVK